MWNDGQSIDSLHINMMVSIGLFAQTFVRCARQEEKSTKAPATFMESPQCFLVMNINHMEIEVPTERLDLLDSTRRICTNVRDREPLMMTRRF